MYNNRLESCSVDAVVNLSQICSLAKVSLYSKANIDYRRKLALSFVAFSQFFFCSILLRKHFANFGVKTVKCFVQQMYFYELIMRFYFVIIDIDTGKGTDEEGKVL